MKRLRRVLLIVSIAALIIFFFFYNKHELVGIASWYGNYFHGRETANCEKYDMYGISAAHRTLPFNTVVRVTRLDTGQSINVRINDRGPYKQGRIIDLSYGAAKKLGIVEKGLVEVNLKIIKLGDGKHDKCD